MGIRHPQAAALLSGGFVASELDIFNGALNAIGHRLLTQAEVDGDSNKAARRCKAVYSRVRKETIARLHWNDCLVREEIESVSSTAPAHGFANAFDIPAACIRVISVDDNDPDSGRWVREGRQILTDQAAPLPIVYLGDTEDSDLLTGLIESVLVLRLALEIVEAITQSNTKKQALREALDDLMEQVEILDVTEQSEYIIEDGDAVMSRYTFVYPGSGNAYSG